MLGSKGADVLSGSAQQANQGTTHLMLSLAWCSTCSALARLAFSLAHSHPVADAVVLQVNAEIVNCQRVASQAGQRHLQRLIERHVAATGSRLGQSLLDTWQVCTSPLPCALCSGALLLQH